MSRTKNRKPRTATQRARTPLLPPFRLGSDEDVRRFRILLALVSAVYLLSISTVPIGDTDDHLMLTGAFSFSEMGKFLAPTRFATKDFQGFLFGAATAAGEVYSKYPPGYSLVLLLFLPPAALAGTLFGSIGPEIVLSMPSVLALLATMVLLRRASLRLGFDGKASSLLGLSYGLGSYAWGYAGTNYHEPFQALCAIAAFYCLLAASQETQHTRTYLLGGGLSLGFGILLRPYFGILAPALVLGALALWWRELGFSRAFSRATLFAAPAIVASVYVLAANLVVFGSATNFGYKNELFDTPFLKGLYGLVLGPRKGLVWFFPLALIVPWSAWKLWNSGRRWAVTVLAAAAVSQILLISKWWGFESGRAWGDRLILAVVPFVVLLAGGIAGSVKVRRIAVALIVAGIAVNSLGVLVNRMAYQLVLVSSGLPRSPGEPRTGQIPGHLWLLVAEVTSPVFGGQAGSPVWKRPPWIRKFPTAVPPAYEDAANPVLNPWPIRIFLPRSKWTRKEYGYERALLEIAIMRYEQRNLARAVALLDRGLALNPKSAEFLAAKGMTLMAEGDTGGALRYFDRAIIANPRYDLALFGQALILEATGDRFEARDIYERILAMPEGQLDRGEVRRRLESLPR